MLQGDAADEDLLLEENIEDTDAFCAVTNDDEANIPVRDAGQAAGRAQGDGP